MLPFIATAKKKTFANPCDSLTKIVNVSDDLKSAKICDNIYNAMQAYSMRQKETLSVQKIDDSTLIITGDFVMTKATVRMIHED